MSIILEALKKASAESVAERAAEPHAITFSKNFLFVVIAVSALVAALSIRFYLRREPAVVSESKNPPIAEGYSIDRNTITPSPAPKQETAPAFADIINKIGGPRLTLSGIVYGIGKPAAIIENKILEEGASVKGAKIVRIHSDRVEMLDEATGQTFFLKVD